MKIETQFTFDSNDGSSGPTNLIDSFKHCDRVIREQRRAMSEIRTCTAILNVLAIMLSAALSTVFCIDATQGEFCMVLLNVLIALALIIAVLHMWRTIKATNFVFPNEKLVSIHVCNFIAWLLVYGTEEATKWRSLDINAELEGFRKEDEDYG